MASPPPNPSAPARAARLQQVLEACRSLSATLQPHELYKALVRFAATLTDSSQGAVLRYDPTQQDLYFEAAPWLSAEQRATLRLNLDDNPIGQAYRSRWAVLAAAQPQWGLRSLLAVPLVVEGTALGVLCAADKRSGEFDHADVLAMEALAAQAAISIENAEMLQQARQGYTTLAELDKMRNDFIAITSHELRIPLGLILGHASFLAGILEEGEARQQSLVIEKAALRLKDIVEDLSKIELAQNGTSVLRVHHYDLAEQARRVVTAHHTNAAEAGIQLTLAAAEAVFINADSNKVFVALDHLLKNALRFTNRAGRVQVEVSAADGEAIVTVADSGIGIPAADLPRIFDRFYQVEDHMTRRHGGMGLGLSIARTLVEMHGGQLSAESVEGKGSRFVLRLPQER